VSFEYRIHDRCACGSSFSSGAAFETAQRFVLQGTERVYERPRPFRIDHIDLDLSLDHDARSFDGEAVLTVTRVDRDVDALRLDAVGFDIEAVHVRVTRAQGKVRKRATFRPVDHVYDGDALHVPVHSGAETAQVRVRYRARPRRGMYFLAPDEHVPARPHQVWTQCQDEDARHVFPCHDKPHIRQTMDVRVSVQPGWFVLSNGDLSNGKQEQARGRYHYKMRDALPSYLFTIVAGEFAKIPDHVGKLPVDYYVPAGREDEGKRTFGRTPDMIRLFSKLTGVDYPWSKYTQVVVHDFIFGGMENTGATTMYEHILLDERAAIDISSDDLIAHELAHQWFGDYVTCRDWSHAWLNEGFATYMEHVWREHHLGRDEYHQGLAADLGAYLGEAQSRYQRPVVCQDYEAPIDIFDRHLYEKGGLFLHALRCELGDEVFWKGIRRYLTKHARGVVETRDLMRALEEESGLSLEEPFEHVIYRAGHARADVSVEHGDGLLVISVKQSLAKDERPFAFPLEIDIAERQNGTLRRERRQVTKASHSFAFPMSARPRYVVIDPEQRIVGRLQQKAPSDMLRCQLAEAPTARGRALAADALASRDDPKTIQALGEALRDRRVFWGARAAAAQALGNIRSAEAFEHLRAMLRTRQPKVRRAVVQALGNFKTKEAADLLLRMARDDESILVAAAACRALGTTRQSVAYEALVGLLDRPSWGEVLRAGAIAGLAALRDERGVDALRERTRYGVPNRARRAAIAAIAQLSTSRKTRELLEDLLDEADPHLRVEVAEALGELADPKSRAALRRQLDRDLDGRVRRRIREVLRDLGGRGRRELRRMREELEDLRRQHADLRARLSKLEDRTAPPKPARKRRR
jgi:aminopeptidase N